MSTQSNHRPFWKCACFKKRLLSAAIPLVFVLVVVIFIGLNASTATAANSVAMDNLWRAFNPTLVDPPAARVGEGSSSSFQKAGARSAESVDTCVAQQNIARIFNPALLTAGLNTAVSSQRAGIQTDAAASNGGDVAKQNIDRLFKSPSVY